AVAVAALAAGPTERAAELLGLAAAVRERIQTPATVSEREEDERVASRVRDALGERGFLEAYERGGTYKLDDAAGLM
ncbi:MAG: hypothetical protein HOW59_38210, partial [Nonomuraea sp.]|nr:hypothetical protein [Nonomuraea sp.]